MIFWLFDVERSQWVCYLRIHSQTLSRQAEKRSENRTTSVFLRSALCLSSDASRRLIFITYASARRKETGKVILNKRGGDRWRGTQVFSLPTCLLRMMNSTAAPPSSSALHCSTALNTDRKRTRQKERNRRVRDIENLAATQTLPY